MSGTFAKSRSSGWLHLGNKAASLSSCWTSESVFLPDLILTLAAGPEIPERLLERAVQSLDDADEDRRLAAMWVMAASKRLDLVLHLQQILERGVAGSRPVIVAIRALRLMQAKDDATVELLVKRLEETAHEGEAGELLLRIGTRRP